MTAESKRAALADALALLARRDFSSSKLGARLISRGHPESEVAAALQQCVDFGYIDDRAYGLTRASDLFRRRPCGRRALLHDLRRQGLARTMTEQVAGQAYENAGGESAVLADALQRWVDRHGEPEDWPAIRRCADHLARRGFTRDLVHDAISPWLDELST